MREMKKLNFYFLAVFATMALFMVSCGEDEVVGNKITITVEEPLDGAKIDTADCDEVHIHVEFEATDENHEIEIVLHPEGDVNDKIIDFDKHDHDKKVVFEQEVDLCAYASGTCFHLEVVACVDHDCAEKATADVEFCLQ